MPRENNPFPVPLGLLKPTCSMLLMCWHDFPVVSLGGVGHGKENDTDVLDYIPDQNNRMVSQSCVHMPVSCVHMPEADNNWEGQ